jgi:hypothetical protein
MTRKPTGNVLPSAGIDDPWALVWGQPYIDAARLAAAIDADLQRTPSPDFRTRLLVRDSARALKAYWGPKRFEQWLMHSPVAERIRDILTEKLGKTGYHNIRRRLVASLSNDRLERIFELLGQRIYDRVEVHIAGSAPTLVEGLTSRPTDDIDFVNEVPAEIRSQRATLDQIKDKFGLTFGHVQSHYLPANWRNRRKYFGDFGGLRVYIVDVYDVFVSKLSSNQEKHKDDLMVMATKLDKQRVKERLLGDGKDSLENPFDRPKIEANWQFAFREPLFPESIKSESAGPLAPPPDEETVSPKKPRRKRK